MAQPYQQVFVLVSLFFLLATLLPACTPDLKRQPPSEQSSDQPITQQRFSCVSDGDCITSGCSGTFCQPANAEPAITTCEWKEAYSCYAAVSCVCKSNACQWDDQDLLDACLKEYQP